MAMFSKFSENNLSSLHPDLQLIHRNSISRIDYRIQEGHRGQSRQHLAKIKKFSKADYPYSMHNTWPSLASDIVPWPFDYSEKSYNNNSLFKPIIDIIKEEARKLGIVLNCGIDWRGGWDKPHIELVSRNGVKYRKTFKINDP